MLDKGNELPTVQEIWILRMHGNGGIKPASTKAVAEVTEDFEDTTRLRVSTRHHLEHCPHLARFSSFNSRVSQEVIFLHLDFSVGVVFIWRLAP
jgi:hypothetical protein